MAYGHSAAVEAAMSAWARRELAALQTLDRTADLNTHAGPRDREAAGPQVTSDESDETC